jgi:hypothetical protein
MAKFKRSNRILKPTHPLSPLLLEKEKGERKEAAKIHNTNLMKESNKSPSLPSKRGI